MRDQPMASPDDIDLVALGIAVRRSLAKLLVATLGVGIACAAVLSMLTPKYASQTQIEIVSKGLGNPFEPRRDASSSELVSVRMDKEAIATHVRALMSSDLALKVATDLRLATEPEFNSALVERGPVGEILHMLGLMGPRAGESEEDRVLSAYYDALRVYQVKDTRGIMIDFRSADPRLAAGAANKLAEVYRDDLGQRAVLESKDASAKLAPQIRKLAEEVAADPEIEGRLDLHEVHLADVGEVDHLALAQEEVHPEVAARTDRGQARRREGA